MPKCTHEFHRDYRHHTCGKTAKYDPDESGKPTRCGTHRDRRRAAMDAIGTKNLGWTLKEVKDGSYGAFIEVWTLTKDGLDFQFLKNRKRAGQMYVYLDGKRLDKVACFSLAEAARDAEAFDASRHAARVINATKIRISHLKEQSEAEAKLLAEWERIAATLASKS